ncbi:hypothetical protein D3C73_1018310 [compost metagenome]
MWVTLRKLVAKPKQARLNKPLLPYPSTAVRSQGKASNVVIVCISGRAGGVSTSGMSKLQNTLRNKLTSKFGIKATHIFHRSWNEQQDSNPFGAPLIIDLIQEINARSIKPSYLAIIGHSFGGWAACRLSRVTKSKPNFIGLIDPVFGYSNKLTSGDVPNGAVIKNWYQEYGITGGEACRGGKGKIPCVPHTNGLSCGFQTIPGARFDKNVIFLRTWGGKKQLVNCGGKGRVALRASHIDIDDDEWIHHQIFNQIDKDLSKLLKNKRGS